jgi:hypothetical protein
VGVSERYHSAMSFHKVQRRRTELLDYVTVRYRSTRSSHVMGNFWTMSSGTHMKMRSRCTKLYIWAGMQIVSSIWIRFHAYSLSASEIKTIAISNQLSVGLSATHNYRISIIPQSISVKKKPKHKFGGPICKHRLSYTCTMLQDG